MIILKPFWFLLFILPTCLTNKYEVIWNLHGKSGEGYYLATEIGTPSQQFNLLLDTGSSNLAIAGFSYPGLDSYYKPERSSSFQLHNETLINITYFQGSWQGYLAKDLFSIPSIDVEAILTDVAVIKTAKSFYVKNSHWQGILGLAYKPIAKPYGEVMPWFDSIVEEYHQINAFTLQLCGPDFTIGEEKHYGNFSIGDSKNCSLSNYSTTIFREGFYEVVITELHVGNEKLAVPCVELNSPRTIIDSGTTNLQLPNNIFESVIDKLIEKVEQIGLIFSKEFWYKGGFTCLDLSLKEWQKFPWITIYFNMNDGYQFGAHLSPTSYLRPSLGASNDTHACIYLGIEQSHVGTVLGAVVMEGFCLHFNRAQKRIFFSKSDCGPNVNILELYNPDQPDCEDIPTRFMGSLIASVIVLTLIILPLLLTVAKWGYEQMLHRRRRSVPFISLSDGVT